MDVALITGVTGQDGSYLAELLLEKGYIVFGVVRRSSSFNTERIESIFNHKNIRLRYGDVTDFGCIVHILEEIKALDTNRVEIYNLAAMSHVKVSFEVPLYTAQVDAIGTLNVLEAIRATKLADKARFYQASTSEMYGQVQTVPQNELTPFYPRSPYGVAKLYAHWIVKNYRESYGMYCCSGILFNHEGYRRGKTFVTRKISIGVAKIKVALEKNTDVPVLRLGNIDALRDWGWAPDYVRGMWMMLSQSGTPEDIVLATGEYHTVREFIDRSFSHIGIKTEWNGKTGLDEKLLLSGTDTVLVEIDEKYFRPAEVEQLLGDPTLAKSKLGWEPVVTFDEMVQKMVTYDYECATSGRVDVL